LAEFYSDASVLQSPAGQCSINGAEVSIWRASDNSVLIIQELLLQ